MDMNDEACSSTSACRGIERSPEASCATLHRVSKTTKVILIVLAAVLISGIVGIGTCVGLAAIWFDRNQDNILDAGHSAIDEGEAFGAEHTLDECVDEGLRRVDACGAFGMVCEATSGIFMTACFESSDPNPGFCDGVPSPQSIMETVQWSLAYCEEKGRPNRQPCTRVVQNIQRYCHQSRPMKAPEQPGLDGGWSPMTN